MITNNWETKPSSFAETVELVENFVLQEIRRETEEKQLYYHTIDHALAVKRRAKIIFQAIAPTLNQSQAEINRLASIIDLCAISHDMVQKFSVPGFSAPRQRIPGVSEVATSDKLIKYINNLNQALAKHQIDPEILFADSDLSTIKEAILATICDRDPQAGKTTYSFSPFSIYQPYLYDPLKHTSLAAKIVALADLGALGIDGVEQYIKEGILVFLEDNLDLKCSILNGEVTKPSTTQEISTRLLSMTRFIVNLAKERQARFELEIMGFTLQARQILREQVFIYLDSNNINQIQAIVPTSDHTTLKELVDFFCLNKLN